MGGTWDCNEEQLEPQLLEDQKFEDEKNKEDPEGENMKLFELKKELLHSTFY